MEKPVVFLFSGQGSQYYHMGREFYKNLPVFAGQMDSQNRRMQLSHGFSVIERLYDDSRSKADIFDDMRCTGPALFMVEHAAARSLESWGIRPDALLGASLGEFVACAIAGVVDANEALDALMEQNALLDGLGETGGMTAVMSRPELYYEDAVLHGRSELAAIHFSEHFVVSGTRVHLEEIENHLHSRGVLYQRLPVRHAFHSSLMDGAEEACKRRVAGHALKPPLIELISCTTGSVLREFSPAYFWQVIRQPIYFERAVRYLEARGPHLYVDISPSGTLSTFVRYILGERPESEVFGLMSPFGQDWSNLNKLLARFGIPEEKALLPTATEAIRRESQGEGKSMKAWIFPGQGSQRPRMGEELFNAFPDLVHAADDALGWSVRDVCLNGRQDLLTQTEYTQPALYVVNALSWRRKLEETGAPPDYVAGHSLGEYNALLAAGVFDFETGLVIVKERARLMAMAAGGAMAAILDLDEREIRSILKDEGLEALDIANLNAPSQTVISGPAEIVDEAIKVFEQRGAICIPLQVSGAFHSRYMRPSAEEFSRFLRRFRFGALKIPVISNAHARPYEQDRIVETLVEQMVSPVRWTDSVRHLLAKGALFEEIGPGCVLSGLVARIQQETPGGVALGTPLCSENTPVDAPAPPPIMNETATAGEAGPLFHARRIAPESLGSESFRRTYGVKYSYVAGAMGHGISSESMVIRLGETSMLGFFGTAGLKPERIEDAILKIQDALGKDRPYGMNLMNNLHQPSLEESAVDLFLRYGVRNVEASAYARLTAPLVKYRLHGLSVDGAGKISVANRIMAKVSRPDTAEIFLSPAPEKIVRQLASEGRISERQAELAHRVPMADDVCVESDSGGHTDMGSMPVLLPTILRSRDAISARMGYAERTRLGAAGGVGRPEGAGAAFMLGAEFILTGSVNQCTGEAGASDMVKDMLAAASVEDMEHAPSGEMFELGARAQYLRKGVFFPSRAMRLQELYRQFDSIERIDHQTRSHLEERYFKCGLDRVWEEVRDELHCDAPDEIEEASRNPKYKMALIFRRYFTLAMRWALEGRKDRKVDFLIYCGPALGAFNRWAKGTELESWRSRHVEEIAERLMNETAAWMGERLSGLLHMEMGEEER